MNIYNEYTFDDVVKFNLTAKDKIIILLVAASSSVSMALFAYRTFRSWSSDSQMFLFVGISIGIIIVIWAIVLWLGANRIIRMESILKARRRSKKKKRGTGKRRRGGSVANVDIDLNDDDEEEKVEEIDNAQSRLGFATGEFGLGSLAPGLV